MICHLSLSQLQPLPGVHAVLLPVLPLVSPSHFSLRLAGQQEAVAQLVATMTSLPPPVEQGWRIGRHQSLAVLHEGAWCRGVAVKKTEEQYSVYRVDFGDLVLAVRDSLRPLAAEHLALAPACLQVCLGGVGPAEGEVWQGDLIQVSNSWVRRRKDVLILHFVRT